MNDHVKSEFTVFLRLNGVMEMKNHIDMFCIKPCCFMLLVVF